MSFDLKNYTIVSKIGFGGFGEVYKVTDNKTEKIYAAKISTKNLDHLDESLKRNFEREVSIISKIHHPSILKFIGMSMTDFHDEKKPVIVTDYMQNGSLDDILSSSHNGIPPEQWNDTMKLINIYGIASAMAFLHENDIIHRDLKPANILLNEYLFPVLADFGLSKDKDAKQSTVEIKGTPLYIAPEIWEDVLYSKEADVYAYAFILYEIYANEKPFKDLTMFKLSQKVCNGKRPDTSCIEEPYKSLIEDCWSQEPSERLTFKEIVQKLENDSDFITSTVEENDFIEYVDFIKNSPKSVDKKVTIDEFDINKTKVIKKVDLKKRRIYPKDEYEKLSKSAKKTVDAAIDDPTKQYEVGLNLVNGTNEFPQDSKLGVKYLKKAIKNGVIDAVIFYNRNLIIGKKIDGDNEKAKQNLKNYEYLKNPEITFLQAMSEKVDGNFKKTVKLLKKAIKGGCAEAMFEYGKMLYTGEGVEEEDQDEANEYFEMAKENGCEKVEKFLKKQNKEKKKSKTSHKKKQKYEKSIDLVILIDGTNSNKNFMEVIKSCFDQIARETIEEHPTIHFRFSVISYRDFILSLKSGSEQKRYPFFIELTDDIEQVQQFLEKQKSMQGSIKYANDWDSGYFVLLEKMNWDEDAEKVVIHMCHTPAHGNGFTMKRNLHNKFFKIPRFGQNTTLKQNKGRYYGMQKSYKQRFIDRIKELAEKEIKFYCLNGNEVSLYCFKKVSEKFFENGGKKFVVKDLFGYTSTQDDDDDDIDIEALKDQVDHFFSNVINCCAKDDDDENDFERKCNTQFKNDLNKFFKQNCGAAYKTTETTETDAADEVEDEDDDDDLVDDNDDDFDDDDDEIIDTKNKKSSLKKGPKSVPKIPKYEKPDNSERKTQNRTKLGISNKDPVKQINTNSRGGFNGGNKRGGRGKKT